MSKEESLKKVELKVNVNCCDGCKKKVLKALNIKGALRTEIHPTLPKVTITGTIDVGTLLKKLSKSGKPSELLHFDYIPQSAEKVLSNNSTESITEASREQVENSKKKKKTKKKNSDSIKVQVEQNSEKKAEIIIPEVRCSVNHGTVPARFHVPEAFRAPAPGCSMVEGPGFARQEWCNFGVPTVYHNIPPEGGGIADYFNDENTMGCHVM